MTLKKSKNQPYTVPFQPPLQTHRVEQPRGHLILWSQPLWNKDSQTLWNVEARTRGCLPTVTSASERPGMLGADKASIELSGGEITVGGDSTR